MPRNAWKLLVISLLGLSTGCMFTTAGRESPDGKPRNLHAYGKQWTLDVTVRFDSQWYLAPLILDRAERAKSLLYLRSDDGREIPLHDRIFALQRDGSYRKVACCAPYMALEEPVVEIEDKLIFFMDGRQALQIADASPLPLPPVTDCFKDMRVQFIGEFDPGSERITVKEFFSGATGAERRDAGGPFGRYRLMYEHRRAFSCG